MKIIIFVFVALSVFLIGRLIAHLFDLRMLFTRNFSLKAQFKRAKKSSPWIKMLLGEDFVFPADVIDKTENGEPVSAHSLHQDPKQACSVSKISEIKPSKWDKKCQKLDNYAFFENIWGVKIADQVLYDLEDYSLDGAVKLASQFIYAELYSDTIIKYYQNGKRSLEEIKPLVVYRIPSPYENWKCLSFKKAQMLFPELFSRRAKKKFAGQSLLYSPDKQKFRLISQLEDGKGGYTKFTDFKRLDVRDLTEWRFGQKYPKWLTCDFLTTSLRSEFRKFLQAYQEGNYSYGFSCQRGYYSNSFSLFAGFPNMSYKDALEVAQDKEQIRNLYFDNDDLTTFNMLQDGTYLNLKDDVCLMPIAFYANWAKPFTKSELLFLFRKRHYSHKKFDVSRFY